MATVVNFIDVTLRGAAARTVNLASAQILLTPSAPAFHVSADGVVTPPSITFTATRIDIDAPLTFNCTGGTLTNTTATTVTLAGADMVGSSATVIASATVNDQTYTCPCTISKFSDGKDGKDATDIDLSPGALKEILEGQLTTDELDGALRNRIGLIDAGADMAGSVAARVKAETDQRIAAISQASTENRTYVQQYTYSQQTINDSFSAFGTNIQAAYQGYANGAADGALAAAKSFAQSYSYSKADADSSLTATANQLRSEFATLNQGTGATVAWVQEYAYSKAQANDAIASATQQLSTTVAGHTSTLEIQGNSISGLGAQYTVKIDNNSYVSGFGLASTPINGVPTSSFIVLADRFAVGLPGQAAKYPFVIGTVNGQTVIGLRGDVVLDGTLNIRATDGLASAIASASANVGFVRPIDDSTAWSGGSVITISDGKVGPLVRRNAGAGYETAECGMFTPIDRSRTYRVRFWARAAAGTNGFLYHDLRQYTAANVNAYGPANSGRDPYNPLRAGAHTEWREYVSLWNSANWQPSTTHVKPDFLLNYDGNAGYWEIQGYSFEDVTEVLKAQAAADAANAAITNISSDNVLSKGEKSEVIRQFAVMNAEFNDLYAQGNSFGLNTNPYLNSKAALNTYLNDTIPTWSDVSVDTPIDGPTFRTVFTNYYAAKQALDNAIKAKSATTANWNGGLAGRPSDSALLNSAVTIDTNGRLLGAGGGQVQNLPVVDGARSVNYAPRDYGVVHVKEFKVCDAIGLPGVGGYCTLETMKPWTDNSGGNATQWAYAGDQTWRRTGGCGDDHWGPWVRDLDRTAYIGDLNASSDIVLVGRGVVLNGNAATKNTGVSQWGDADCYSLDAFYGGAYASAVVVNPVGCAFMFGLNSDPATDASYQSIDYAIYNEYGKLFVYNSSVPYNGGQQLGSLADGDVIAVRYDGSYVRYERNGTLFLTLYVPGGQKLSMDSAFHTTGMTLKNIKFGPMSDVSAGVAANAAIPAINAALGGKLDAAASNILRAPITITTGGGLVVGSLTYDANTGLRGSGAGVAVTPYGMIVHNGARYTFALNGATGDSQFGGMLDAAYGSFGNLRVAPGGAICSGPFYGAWSWNGPSAAGGFQISEQGILGGNRDNPNIGYFQVNFLTGEIYMPGLQVYNRQLTLDKPIILNPVLSPFKVSVVNSLNQYDYNLYRQSTDAYAGLYIATVDSGNDGATFNWAVSGPWPCWLVQDSASNRVQLHINMKGGAALVGDEGDFNISLSVTKGGNTVQSGTFVVARAS